MHRVSLIFDEMAEIQNRLGSEKDESKRGILKEKLGKLSEERETLQVRLIELERKKQQVLK